VIKRLITPAVALSILFLLAASCAAQGGGTVTVNVREWAVEPDVTSIGAGTVKFVVVNQGAETHELVVVKAASVDELPLDADGAFDEASFGNVMGEVEDVAALTQKEFTLDLEAGAYLLLCNIVDTEASGEKDSHFSHAMYAGFTVDE
jgi:microcompartment protein CcmK/EutM